MTNAKDSPIRTTGTFDFGAGVDSLKVPTVYSANNPDGLSKQELAWGVNLTMRDGALSPRDPWIKRGWINQSLPPQILPGTPQQTIPQPNIPPIQTPAAQSIQQVGTWPFPNVGSSGTMTVSNPYVGNAGDVTGMYSNPGPFQNLQGTFVILGFTSTTITLQTISLASGVAGGHLFNDLIGFDLIALSSGTPQPPIVIPPGPPTVIQCQPFYQGGIIFTPSNGNPYGIMVIGGHVIRVDPNFVTGVIDLSDLWNLYFPVTPRCYFCQAETYLVIQAGDYNPETGDGTLPFFWDGTTLYQSNGPTGVAIVGVPTPNVYVLNLAAGWTPNDTVGGFSTLVLASQYPGNIYDNIAISDSSATLGNYRIFGISGDSITVQTLYQASTPSPPITGSLSAVVSLPVLPNGATDATQSVTIGDGSWTIPKTTGSTVLLDLTSIYFGSVGDTINLYSESGNNLYGTFEVVAFNASFQLVLKYITEASPSYSGKAIFGVMLATITACRSFTQSFVPNGAEGLGGPFVVTSAGGTSTVYWPAFDGGPLSKLYDNVQITVTSSGVNLGVFRVVAQGNNLSSLGHSFPYITLQSLVPNSTYQGQSFFVELTMTVVKAPTVAGYLTVNAGTWTVPNVGQSVSLQMLWPDVLGPSYPGNLNDQVTLTQGTSTIGVFSVSSFDLNGNITLTTTDETPSTSIGQQFTGAITVTMTISQLPSTIGTNVSQIPAATCMVYYQGIVWYAQGDVISGGDIVGGPSGTNPPSNTNAVLNVTENPLALGGDGFRLPIPGNITGIAWPQQQNASLGQGQLYVFTVNGCCTLSVPTNRQEWIQMTASNLPQINVVLGGKREEPGYGSVNDWGIVPINGDLYFQTIQPGITSIILAQRYFQQWGNIDISNNEQRLWDFTDTSLLSNISGFYFNKRMQMTALPEQTQYGIIHNAIIPMDMTPIDTFEELTPPNWEGMLQGLQIFQLLTSGEFSGQQRSFAVTLNPNNPGEIDLYENVTDLNVYFDNTGTANVPIPWQFETPAFSWESESDLKELVGGSLFVDQIVNEVVFKVEWRPDFASCWQFWCEWTECFEASTLNLPNIQNPSPYPVNLPPGYKPSMDFPRPPQVNQPETGRPAAQAFQFQLRITITGQCRVRGLLLHCEFMKKNIYQFLVGAWKGLVKALL